MLSTLIQFIVSIPTRLALFLILVYKYVLSPVKRAFFGCSCGCRFQPTCSCYAYDAFKHFGFCKAFWVTLRRVLRCHPWHPGGFDPTLGNQASQSDI